MKKYLVIFSLIIFTISMIFIGSGCKTTTVATTTAAETAAATTIAETTAAATTVATTAAETTAASVTVKKGPFKVVWNPSVIGIPFFKTESDGFKEALDTFGDTLTYTGGEKGTPEEQVDILNNLIIQKVDAIDLVPTDPSALNSISKKAMDAGIKMVENGSANMKGNVNISTIIFNPDDVGKILMDLAGELTNFEGEWAILSAAPTSSAQNDWIAGMQKAFTDPKFSKMKLDGIVYGNDIRDTSYDVAQGLFKSYPNLKCIVAPTSVGIAAAGAAVTDAKLMGKVLVTGLGLPSEMKEYVHNGASPKFCIWNPIDLGYFNACVCHYLASGEITGKSGEKFTAGRIGDYQITEDGIITFGKIAYYDSSNVDAAAAQF